MSVRVMTAAWAVDLPAGEKLVLLALADCANDEGKCYPGLASLARKTGKSRRSLIDTIHALEAAGQISREILIGKGTNYTVHPTAEKQEELPIGGAKSAPAQKSHQCKKLRPSGAKSAPKPSVTVIGSEAIASSPKRSRKQNRFPPPAGVPEPAWLDFLNSPKRRKAGMSGTAYAGICNNLKLLAEHGFPPGEMIALAVERGWTTVKLDWVQNDGGRQANQRSMGGPRTDPTLALVRSAIHAQR